MCARYRLFWLGGDGDLPFVPPFMLPFMPPLMLPFISPASSGVGAGVGVTDVHIGMELHACTGTGAARTALKHDGSIHMAFGMISNKSKVRPLRFLPQLLLMDSSTDDGGRANTPSARMARRNSLLTTR